MSNPLRENTRDTCEPPAWDVNMCENHMCRSTFPEKTRKYVQGKSAISAGDVQQSAAEDLFIFTGTIRQPLFFPLWRCFSELSTCAACAPRGAEIQHWAQKSGDLRLLPGSFRAPSGLLPGSGGNWARGLLLAGLRLEKPYDSKNQQKHLRPKNSQLQDLLVRFT